MDALRENIRTLMGDRSEKVVGDESGVGQTWLNRVLNPSRADGIRSPGIAKLRLLATYFGVSVERLTVEAGEATTQSQPARLDDDIMSRAVELLYILSDARPDDKRFARLTLITSSRFNPDRPQPRPARGFFCPVVVAEQNLNVHKAPLVSCKALL